MIYLLYGSDTDKARTKLHDVVASLLAKKPDASHMRLSDETFTEGALSEFVGGMGLFSSKTIVEMDSVFRNKEYKESVLKRLKEIGESENIFVFLEAELNKADLSKFEKQAEKVQEFTLKESAVRKAKKEFNIFSLTDALGQRNKKNLWVLYQKALMDDKEPEEIHGLLFWQAKSMWLARDSKDAKASGLNPFVYSKSLGYSGNFEGNELQKLTSDLVTLYHEARRGKFELSEGLERFILSV